MNSTRNISREHLALLDACLCVRSLSYGNHSTGLLCRACIIDIPDVANIWMTNRHCVYVGPLNETLRCHRCTRDLSIVRKAFDCSDCIGPALDFTVAQSLENLQNIRESTPIELRCSAVARKFLPYGTVCRNE